MLALGVSIVAGVGAFFVQLEPELLQATWKAEPADIHSEYYGELLGPLLFGED